MLSARTYVPLLGATLGTVHGGAVELDHNNFASTTAGKGAFVKFLAPW